MATQSDKIRHAPLYRTTGSNEVLERNTANMLADMLNTGLPDTVVCKLTSQSMHTMDISQSSLQTRC